MEPTSAPDPSLHDAVAKCLLDLSQEIIARSNSTVPSDLFLVPRVQAIIADFGAEMRRQADKADQSTGHEGLLATARVKAAFGELTRCLAELDSLPPAVKDIAGALEAEPKLAVVLFTIRDAIRIPDCNNRDSTLELRTTGDGTTFGEFSVRINGKWDGNGDGTRNRHGCTGGFQTEKVCDGSEAFTLEALGVISIDEGGRVRLTDLGRYALAVMK